MNGRKQVLNILLVAFLFLIFGICGSNRIVYAADNSTIPDSISAEYNGGSVLVGNEYDEVDLTVTVTFKDGSTKVITNYTTGSKKVSSAGDNTFTIVYYGKVDRFTVIGKNVTGIQATYTGSDTFSVGNKVPTKDVTVSAEYSDGSSEEVEDGYTLTNAAISKVGTNTVNVTYGGKNTKFEVIGVAAPTIDSIYAVALASRIVGGKIDENIILVTALYKDGAQENIYNFTANPATVASVGSNKVTVSYRGKSTTCTIVGIQKSIESITVSYTGGDVTVGRSVKDQDVTVKATYNDGSTGTETEFSLLNGGKVSMEGTNVITVVAGSVRAEFTVVGVAVSAADFTSAPKYDITNGRKTGIFTVALPAGYTTEDLSIVSLDTSLVKRILTREIRNGDYIPFEMKFVNLDLDIEIPLTIQISIPSDYQIDGCALYYSPNRKSVLAMLNTDIVDNKIQMELIHEGMYILTYDPDWKEKLKDAS